MMKNTFSKLMLGLAIFAVATLALSGVAYAVEPTVETRPATNIDDDSVRLNGRLNPEDRSTDFWFEYGRTTSLEDETPERNAGSFDAEISVFHDIRGLRPDTTYYFRLVAENSSGISRGAIRSFTTDDDSADRGDEPVVTTGAARATGDNMILEGDVEPEGNWVQVWFRYGRSSGSLAQSTPMLTIFDDSRRDFTRTISNRVLERGVTYFYQAVARNNNGTDFGQIRSFVASGGELGTGGGSGDQAPLALTVAANVLGNTSAQLRAQVDPNGSLSSVWFQYGRTTALGGATTRDPAGSGDTLAPYTMTLAGLSPGTTYFYRAASQNPYGTSFGQILSFTTTGTRVGGGGTGGGTPPPSGSGGGDDDDDEPVGAPGCFEVTPALSSPQLQASQDFVYSLTYRNDCGNALSGARLTITMPPEVDFAGTNMPFLSRDGNIITYDIGSIADNFQAAVTVNGRVKERVETGDLLIFQADMEFSGRNGARQEANGLLTANIVNDPEAEAEGASTSTLGATVAETLGGLLQSGWFWLVLFLILIALFVFWMASRRRGEEEDEDEEVEVVH